MRLLVDTDAFCKLAVGGILDDAIRLLGADLSDCGRLPALPHMLRRGRLRKIYGPAICDALVPVAATVPILPRASAAYLEKLTSIEAIDPGEAQIFAVAAERHLILVSGDKRALRVLRNMDVFPRELAGRIVVLEAILLALCEVLGSDVVRQRIQPLTRVDAVIKVCFSNPGSDPREGLRSYFESLANELLPLILWNPWSGGAA